MDSRTRTSRHGRTFASARLNARADRGGRSRSAYIAAPTIRTMTADAPGVPPVDLHTTAGKLSRMRHKRDEAVHAGSEKAIASQHDKGKMTARERVEAFLDPGSFVETDALARHRSNDFGMEAKRPYGDGVVTGFGTVDGRQVC